MIDGDDLLERLKHNQMNGLPIGAQIIHHDEKFVHIKVFVLNQWF